MIELVIKKADGELYWREHFNDMESGEKWLAEEKNRPYWKAEYAHEFIDKNPPPKPQSEIDAENANRARLAELSTKHKAMTGADLSTLVQLKDAILELQELMGLK